jgi:hypothetical protein
VGMLNFTLSVTVSIVPSNIGLSCCTRPLGMAAHDADLLFHQR